MCGLVDRVAEVKLKIMLTKLMPAENASKIQLPAVLAVRMFTFLFALTHSHGVSEGKISFTDMLVLVVDFEFTSQEHN